MVFYPIQYELRDDLEQAGFRPGSSCVGHINTLRIIIADFFKVDFQIDFQNENLSQSGYFSKINKHEDSARLLGNINPTFAGHKQSCQAMPIYLCKSNCNFANTTELTSLTG